MAGAELVAQEALTGVHQRVIEKELRIIATDAKTSGQRPREFHAAWRLTGEKQVSGELRSPRDGRVVGHMAVTWRNLTDSLGETPLIGGSLAVPARLFRVVADALDPATGLGEIEIEIDETVFGRPVSRSARAETKANQWVVQGAAGDWWARLAVFRAGVPTPVQFAEP
jgi:hypothetical protein